MDKQMSLSGMSDELLEVRTKKKELCLSVWLSRSQNIEKY